MSPLSARIRRSVEIPVLVLLLLVGSASRIAAQVPSPEEFFGFRMGADGQLAGWPSIERYFQTVASASDRVELVNAGPTTEGRRMIAAIITAPENIGRLDQIRTVNRRLADPRTLDPEEARRLAAIHPTIVAIGCSIHSTEIGATQAANELLHSLATTTDPANLEILRNVVLILFPSLNPDGHALVVDWYERNRGTRFETAPMPWLYHKYVGHDINRDAFMMNLAESRTLARFFYRDWHPQIFLTLHQMGQKGPRFFVPPNYDPIDANYDPLIWRTAGLLGHAMALELERENRSGVVSNALFDYYWPGYEDSAPLGHNVVCLLTEAASAQLALPVTIAPGELTGSPRGLPEYRPQLNFPSPWPGGTWRLRDIVDYELTAVRGLLAAASRYRDQIVQNFYSMGSRAVAKGRAGGPFAFILPPEQHDPHAAAKLVNLLIEGGVETLRAEEPFRADGHDYPAGTTIVPMAQPFRAYAKTLLERQDYPARTMRRGEPPEPPYDVAGWTLPDQMGVAVARIERWFEVPAMSRLDRGEIKPAQVWGERRPAWFVIEGSGNAGAIAVNRLHAAGLKPSWTRAPLEIQGYTYAQGSIVVRDSKPVRKVVEDLARTLGLRATGAKGRIPADLLPLQPPRLALYRPWFENIDEGWTRWLFEQYEFPFTSVSDQIIRAGGLRTRFDAIVLPSASPDRLIGGHPTGTVPPEYAGGLGSEGVDALKAFVAAGGTLICLDASSRLAIEALGLPVKDATADLRSEEFLVPGSIVRLTLDPGTTLAYGMEPETSAFFANGSAYTLTSPPALTEGHTGAGRASGIHVIGRYGTKDLLLSGWGLGENRLAGQPAILEARMGQGRAVLIGFRAQHRAQSHATFRVLFNAILTASGN